MSIARGRWLRQDEDDLVHDCMVNWYENQGKWAPGRASEKTFLKRITDNYLVSLWRKKQARLQNLASLEAPFELDDEDGGSLYDVIPDDGPMPEMLSELTDLQQRVRATLETLDAADREIAEALEVSETATEASERVGRTRGSHWTVPSGGSVESLRLTISTIFSAEPDTFRTSCV